MENKLELYKHNIDASNKIDKHFETDNYAALVHATGTGKNYLAVNFAVNHSDKKTVMVVPSKSIEEHIIEIVKDSKNLTYDDYKNIRIITYQNLIKLSDEELKNLEIDYLFLDEFHHFGAPVWGKFILKLINFHPFMKVIAMSAYTIRDRGTIYERDMANPRGGEFFSGKVVSRYDLIDAMADGILPKDVVYVGMHNFYESDICELEDKLEGLNKNSEEYQKYAKLLWNARNQSFGLNKTKDVFKKYLKPNGKYFYFCPPLFKEGINDIETIKNTLLASLKEITPEENITIYVTTSDMGVQGKKNRDAFYHDKTLDGQDAKNNLRVMLAINQYNEGVHAPNVDGVILGRSTHSDIVYFEQIGRCLSISGDSKKLYAKYNMQTESELLKLCEEKGIVFKKSVTKEDIINRLIAPVIIDLTGNIEFIKKLENNVQDRIKELRQKSSGDARIINLEKINFDIKVINEDLHLELSKLKKRLADYKIYEYIIWVNEHGWLVTQSLEDQSVEFSNGDKMNQYWTSRDNKQRLYTEICKIENSLKYPVAYEVICKKYHEYCNDSALNEQLISQKGENWKLHEYLAWVEKHGRLVSKTEKDRLVKFTNGQFMKDFYYNHREELYNEVCQDAIKEKYPRAYEIITKYYNQNWKILEYISLVNKRDTIITKAQEDASFLFSDGKPMRGFWQTSKDKIYQLVLEYQNIYPHAYEVITYEYNKDSNQKLIEYIACVDKIKRLLSRNEEDQKFTFSDGKKMFSYWQSHKDKLYKLILIEPYKQKYPDAYHIITREYDKTWKLIAYIKWVQENNRLVSKGQKDQNLLFEDGTLMSLYWRERYQDLYDEITKEEMQVKYPVAYEVITSKYTEYISKRTRKMQKQIFNLCQEYGIDIDLNQEIINHLTYQEFISKTSFSLENGLNLTNQDQKLHEIFTMSSLNIKVKYGYTLEELISKYSKERK